MLKIRAVAATRFHFVFRVLLGCRCRWIANSRLLQHRSHSVEQEVEWMYALDIHSNSFFPLFVCLYVVQVGHCCLLVLFRCCSVVVLLLMQSCETGKVGPGVPSRNLRDTACVHSTTGKIETATTVTIAGHAKEIPVTTLPRDSVICRYDPGGLTHPSAVCYVPFL